jgi:hypothetical protein
LVKILYLFLICSMSRSPDPIWLHEPKFPAFRYPCC